MDIVKWIVGITCLLCGVALILLSRTERAKATRFELPNLLWRGTRIDESSSLQLSIEGALGIVLGVAVLLLL